ncbi:D-malate degradation protein R [Kluyvera cryocrescens]|uniref:D-malate degradation protein R n=1 Tax=Kluyvera cryocrescens TaxID=580 RepID=A0A485ABZ6_KLUCR|nr:D-malate degradation protein R [Kluyvera cryocrescens]
MGRFAADSPFNAAADHYACRGENAGEDAATGSALTGHRRGRDPHYAFRNAAYRLRPFYRHPPAQAGYPAFLARYPALRIEVDINNHPVSLVGERIDLAIRITNEPEPGAIARTLGTCRSVLCASPEYLNTAGTPTTLEDLAQHNCLHYSRFSAQSWSFRDRDTGVMSVAVGGNFSAGISSLLCDMAAAGVGLAMVPEIEARSALEKGQLVRVLPHLEPQPLGIYGLYQSRDHQHAALSLFLDALKQHLTDSE